MNCRIEDQVKGAPDEVYTSYKDSDIFKCVKVLIHFFLNITVVCVCLVVCLVPTNKK